MGLRVDCGSKQLKGSMLSCACVVEAVIGCRCRGDGGAGRAVVRHRAQSTA